MLSHRQFKLQLWSSRPQDKLKTSEVLNPVALLGYSETKSHSLTHASLELTTQHRLVEATKFLVILPQLPKCRHHRQELPSLTSVFI